LESAKKTVYEILETTSESITEIAAATRTFLKANGYTDMTPFDFPHSSEFADFEYLVVSASKLRDMVASEPAGHGVTAKLKQLQEYFEIYLENKLEDAKVGIQNMYQTATTQAKRMNLIKQDAIIRASRFFHTSESIAWRRAKQVLRHTMEMAEVVSSASTGAMSKVADAGDTLQRIAADAAVKWSEWTKPIRDHITTVTKVEITKPFLQGTAEFLVQQRKDRGGWDKLFKSLDRENALKAMSLLTFAASSLISVA
jgi:hypothetical protein